MYNTVLVNCAYYFFCGYLFFIDYHVAETCLHLLHIDMFANQASQRINQLRSPTPAQISRHPTLSRSSSTSRTSELVISLTDLNSFAVAGLWVRRRWDFVSVQYEATLFEQKERVVKLIILKLRRFAMWSVWGFPSGLPQGFCAMPSVLIRTTTQALCGSEIHLWSSIGCWMKSPGGS